MSDESSQKKLIVPVINLNGTDPDTLIREVKEAKQKLKEAINAMYAMTLHGRDFQTVDPSVFREAQEQRVDRHAKLHAIEVELDDYYRELIKQARSMRSFKNDNNE